MLDSIENLASVGVPDFPGKMQLANSHGKDRGILRCKVGRRSGSVGGIRAQASLPDGTFMPNECTDPGERS